jgi:N-acylglucosamine 2-epimerase
MLPHAQLAARYRTALLEDVLPFWDRFSPDREHGGFFTCLDRSGAVYDTDKFVWLQGRQTWLYAMLYNSLERRQSWLDTARHGVAFLRTHAMDPQGEFYFALTREGKPLVQPANIFSDCFAVMGFSQYALASGDTEARELSLSIFENILRRRDEPKGRFSKAFPGTRPMRSFSLPMILLNLTLELEWILGPERTRAMLEQLLDEVFRFFHDEERNLFFEHVAPAGSHPDTFDGRLINPGHGIEATWFVMDAARKVGRTDLVQKALAILFSSLTYGWDQRDGGIFYFLDVRGKPPQQLEWDQKLWWVHCEALVALAMAWSITRSPESEQWFTRVHDYTWSRFPDPEHGEWFGYLNRLGEVLLPLKGGKWKGCFHVPRTLYRVWRIFEASSGEQST